MNPEIDVSGLFLPSILVLGAAAYVLTGLLSSVLRAAGAYRFIWHPLLFNVCLFVCLLGVLLFLLQRPQI
jgi:ABC-type multidrug transport system permease subunit